ncbi:glycine receptor subunit alpha-2-like, partial [Saccoglossus kowalevskii]
SYSFSIYLRQQWDDPRLSYDPARALEPSSYLADKIWVPDLMFSHERVLFFMISLQITRISLTLHCEMDFHKFPMDEQKCGLQVESFQYTTAELVFEWIENEPAEFYPGHLKLPQYALIDTVTTNCTKQLKTGWYTCIGLTFILNRELGYYLLQTYIPSILLIILSWVSFWIDIKMSPARVALGITSVLTMITTLNGVRGDLPHVSYIKAIDVWFAMCLVFVVGSLIEYAIVHYLSTNRIGVWNHRTPSKLKKSDNYSGDCCVSLTIVDRSMPPLYNSRLPSTTINKIESSQSNASDEGKIWIRGNCSRKSEAIYNTGTRIDKVCRVAFPVAFVLFNICYWCYYKLV